MFMYIDLSFVDHCTLGHEFIFFVVVDCSNLRRITTANMYLQSAWRTQQRRIAVDMTVGR